MRILVYINHYYGKNPHFMGGSTRERRGDKGEPRERLVHAVLAAVAQLPGSVDVCICGITGRSLMPLDITFNRIADRPANLVYESLNHMVSRHTEYDYYINVEDDILLPPETFQNVLEFDRHTSVDNVLHPNRLEFDSAGRPFCIDLYCIPGWREERAEFQSRELRVAKNPHSGILILNADKLRHVRTVVDPNFRGILFGREMASAYAYFNQSFKLFRCYNDVNYHVVHHLDRFKGSPRFLDLSHPFVPYGYKYRAERFVQTLLPDALYRRLKQRGILPRN